VIDPLIIAELFYSIQGESTWAGLPCAFVRLSGCNLRCRYCDSSYTWEEEGREVATLEVLEWVNQYPAVLCEITGGEPLLQDNIYPLTELLIDNGHKVLIETNGTVSLEYVPPQASVIMDVKCPESGMHARFHHENMAILARRKEQGARDEIKFVLSSEQDYLWAAEMVKEQRLEQLAPVIFSPVTALLQPDILAEYILADQLPVRLQLQLHTLLWPQRNRGV